MKHTRTRALAHSLVILLGLASLAYTANAHVPSWLAATPRAISLSSSMRPVFFVGSIVSVGDYALNVAFASDGKPVCLCVGTKKG